MPQSINLKKKKKTPFTHNKTETKKREAPFTNYYSVPPTPPPLFLSSPTARSSHQEKQHH
jgi:hypothetical protein